MQFQRDNISSADTCALECVNLEYPPAVDVDSDSLISKEICAENRLRDVCQDELPRYSSETQVYADVAIVLPLAATRDSPRFFMRRSYYSAGKN